MAPELHDPRTQPPSGEPLSVTVTSASDLLVISPRGEIDIVSAPFLSNCLESAANQASQPVVIDLAEVSFMDSTGLGTLLRGQLLFRSKGLPLTVRNVNGTVRAVFAMSGTEHTFGLTD